MRPRAVIATVGFVVRSACGPEAPDVDAAISWDAAAADAASPDAPVVPDATVPACFEPSVDVEVTLEIQIEEACAIWNSLSLLSGMATVTRGGEILRIDFGDGVAFAGTVVDGAVSLSYTHLHDFTDGCGWQATETLIGQLDEASCSLTLDYAYVETVVQDNGGCATPCAANADVTLGITVIP